MTNDVNKSYLAAIVDGEGHIGIQEREGRRYISVIAVEMTNPEPINMLQNTFGGHIWQKIIKSGKISYRYSVKPDDQETFIKELLPYMRVKSPQAQCVLQLIDTKKRYPVKGQYHKADIAINQQKRLFNLVKTLNA